MGNIDIDLYHYNSKKSECSLLYKKGIPNRSSLGSSKWHDDGHRPSPNYVFSAASHEHLEKSRLMALQEAALHDSTVLEMGYQVTDCETKTPTPEVALLKDPSIGPLLQTPLKELEGHKAPKPVSLRDLKVGKVHRGRIFSGTLCCKTVNTSAIMNVLEEDGTDDAMMLVISNPMHKNITTAKSQLLYPKGAKLSVQDPYLKRFADGMVGILVENPTEIVFNYLPTDVPSLEKPNTKEELASKRRVGKVQTERPASNKELTECIKKIFSKERIGSDGEIQSSLSRAGKATDQLSALDTELTLCLKKILSKEPVDMNEGNQSCEGTLSTCGSTPGMSINAPPMKIASPMDKGSKKIQELAAPTFVQNDLNSSVDLKRSLNLDYGREVKNFPHKLAEKGAQDCDKLNHDPDNQTLLDCVEHNSVVPQNPSNKCAPTRPSGDTCKGQERNRAEEKDLLQNSGLEQDETDRTRASNGKTDGERTLQEINEVTSGGNILETVETSADFTKLNVDDSLEKNSQTKGSRECGPEVCESSNGKPMENPQNEISFSCREGIKSSPSTTITEKESDSMKSKGNLQNNDADDTGAEAHITPTALRLLGNKYFAQQNWAKAIDLYTQASFKAIQDSVQETKENLSPNHDKILGFFEPQKDASPQKEEHESEVVMDYSNRAEAWLRIHQYERAWADSERALSLDPHHLKSLFRKGRALLGLGDYQQALAHFEACNARTQSDKDVLAAIKLTRIADQQNRLGIYDLTDYYIRGRFAGEVPNFADYIGPVQVKDKIGEKGRGLFLTKSVEAGDLLLVSNPLALVQLESQETIKKDSKAPAGGPTPYEFNPRLSAESEEKLATILLERAKVSNKNCHRLLTLCHGEEESSHQAAPTMDLFISGRQVSPPTEPVETEELDAIRLHKIIARNAITRNMVSTTLEKRHVYHGKNCEENCNDNFVGLWVLPSFINHSCIPNVSLVTMGKCIFVYASRDMDLGEELLCSYFNVFQPLPQRKELASRWWAFQCKCARCLLETKFATILERLRYHHTQIQPTPTFVMKFPPFAEKAVAKEIARELEILHTTEKLDDPEKSWLQASFTQLYITTQDTIGANGVPAPLDTAFGAMEILSASSTAILEVGLLCREYMGRDFKGKRTPKYKVVNQRLVRACKCIFGKHRASVLQSLVEGIPPK